MMWLHMSFVKTVGNTSWQRNKLSINNTGEDTSRKAGICLSTTRAKHRRASILYAKGNRRSMARTPENDLLLASIFLTKLSETDSMRVA